jgi:cyclophilin family peptidyl-prolyl cis-trans isomerase
MRRSTLVACLLCFASLIAVLSALKIPDSAHGSAAADPNPLRHPCDPRMRVKAPETFSIRFRTNLYGEFTATCERARAPVWVDRVYNLAQRGYYDDNYFFRVVRNEHLSIAQFGTNGDPSISNVYNWSTTTEPECAILEPQPPDMPWCMFWEGEYLSRCKKPLANTAGTIAMSTSMTKTDAYPHGVTWNATAELFINLEDNTELLDPLLFVPICEIDKDAMTRVVQRFPSFGEVSDLGGSGPSLGLLYEEGNSYIRRNASWQSMAATTRVTVVRAQGVSSSTDTSSSEVLATSPTEAASTPSPESEKGAEEQMKALEAALACGALSQELFERAKQELMQVS